jgi:lambda family phage portal protein
MDLGNTIDRAIRPLFPGWARRRMIARAQAHLLERALQKRTTAGGIPDRFGVKRAYSLQGPQDKTRTDLAATRSQARDLYRHNPYGRGIANTITANLISTGIKPQGRVVLPKLGKPDEKFNDAAEELWKSWSDGCDPTGKESFYEQQSLLQHEDTICGEVLLVFSEARDGRGIPLATEVIPSERLSMKDEWSRPGEASPTGKKIIQGVQFNTWGGIDGYHIYPNHPSEGLWGYDAEVFVPANRVIHFYNKLEPGSVRGLTRFLPVAGALEGFMQYLDYLLIKERIASAFALAFIKNSGFGLPSPVQPTDDSFLTDDEGNELDIIEGGIIAHLRNGEDIKGIQSGVQAAAVNLLTEVFLRVIARGMDLSYEIVARDLSNVTYLSARQGENQDRRHWEPQQERMNKRVNIPVWRQVLQMGYMLGKLPTRAELQPRHLEVEFVRPGWDWIDPSKDVESDISAISAGIRSPIESVIKRGGDPYKILRDCAQWKDWLKELGMELPVIEQKPKATEAPKPKAASDEDKGKKAKSAEAA